MTAITDLSDAIFLASGGGAAPPRILTGFKGTRRGGGAAAGATVAGRMTSLFAYDGSPSHGAPVFGAQIPTRTTQGAIGQANAGGGRELFLTGAVASASQPCNLFLCDLLGRYGGLSGTDVNAQPCSPGTLTRGLDYVNNEIWINISTLIGTTATTAVVNYNDAGGNPCTSPLFDIGGTGLRELDRVIPVPYQAGATGVSGVTSFDLTGTTGTVGYIDVFVVRRILEVGVPAAGIGSVRDCIAGLPSLPKIEDNACLFWGMQANTTTAPLVNYSLHMLEN